MLRSVCIDLDVYCGLVHAGEYAHLGFARRYNNAFSGASPNKYKKCSREKFFNRAHFAWAIFILRKPRQRTVKRHLSRTEKGILEVVLLLKRSLNEK